MRHIFTSLLISFIPTIFFAQEFIIDHNCNELDDIPIFYIEKAKAELHIGYGHTSHGSQITSGLTAIAKYFTDGRFNWSHNSFDGSIHIFEGSGYGSGYLDHDCGYAGWDDKTREYLDENPDCNVIMWSWCGQVNDVDLEKHYFEPMVELENEYPDVKFVYMTGHLEGLGPDGSLREANDKIRKFCRDNGKILFDFAEIERFDPDGENDFGDLFAADNCNYRRSGGGTGNWAQEWLHANPDSELAKISSECGSCAHSVSLNCVKKGIASWYMFARLAGWQETTDIMDERTESVFKIYPNPANEFLKMNGDLPENSIFSIYDIYGDLVLEGKISGEDKIYISGVASGFYLLRVQIGTNIISKGFLKH